MNTRVEICGLDTSTLPKLKHEEMMELIKKAQSGDEDAREKFIMANLRLVLSVTRRFASKKQRGRHFSGRLYRADQGYGKLQRVV